LPDEKGDGLEVLEGVEWHPLIVNRMPPPQIQPAHALTHVHRKSLLLVVRRAVDVSQHPPLPNELRALAGELPLQIRGVAVDTEAAIPLAKFQARAGAEAHRSDNARLPAIWRDRLRDLHDGSRPRPPQARVHRGPADGLVVVAL